MAIITDIVLRAVTLLIEIIQFFMLARAIMSWIPNSYGNPISQLLYSLTEPFIAPVRKLINKSSIGGGNMPIDIAFFVTFIILSLLPNVLYALF